MLNKIVITSTLFILCCFSFDAQNKKKKDKNDILENIVENDSISINAPIDALAPAKAAFYSAILPGLGQAYNKKYWKIPVVYAALGTGVFFYLDNNKQYNRYRDAFKSRLAGFKTDEFYLNPDGTTRETPRVTLEGLQRAQRLFRRNQEVSLLVSLGLYALNIIDANVDAHLLQYNVDENLSLTPHYKFNDINASNNVGISLNFNF